MDSTVPWFLAAVSSPVMAFKQYLNVLQLVKASKWLAEGDRKKRREMGLPEGKGDRALRDFIHFEERAGF